MSRSFSVTVLTVATLAFFACSDDNTAPPADRGPETVRDGPPADAIDAAPDAPKDGGADAFVAKHEHTIAYGSGVPARRIAPEVRGGLDVRVDPPTAHLPVQLRKIALVPYGVFKYKVSIRTYDGSSPPVTLTQQERTVAAADVGKWNEIDFSANNLVFDGRFYVQIEIIDGLSASATGVVSFSTSGHTVALNSQGLLTTERAQPDILARITYGAANGDAPKAQGDDAASCTHSSECKSGYCVAGACTIACPSSGDCGSGRRCVTFDAGDKICMPDCSSGQSCPTGSFCMTRTLSKHGTFVNAFDPGGICARRGPSANGVDCKDTDDTFCQSGYCSACDTDADCNVTGTCAAKPSGDGGVDGAAADAGSGG